MYTALRAGGRMLIGRRRLPNRITHAFYCDAKDGTDNDNGQIDQMVHSDKVVLFMKGTPQEPMCGFSKLVCKVLEIHDVPFKSYDVLENDNVRQGVKDYSKWPTIPQLYVNGKFIGGSDILVEMHKSGQLTDLFGKEGVPSKFAE